MGEPGRPAAPTLEPTALAAFLVALVLGWCPLTALAAIALGVTALVRIRDRAGTRTGRGLALGAIAIAAAILVGWGVMLERLGTEVWDSMDAQATAAIDAGIGRSGQGPIRWEAAAEPAADRVRDFAERAAGALGEVRSVAITNRTVEGLTARTVTVAFTAAGSKATGFGSATFATDSSVVPPALLLRRMELDVGGQRMSLPATSEESK